VHIGCIIEPHMDLLAGAWLSAQADLKLKHELAEGAADARRWAARAAEAAAAQAARSGAGDGGGGARHEKGVKAQLEVASAARAVNAAAREKAAVVARARVAAAAAVEQADEEARAQAEHCGRTLLVCGHREARLNGLYVADAEHDKSGFPQYRNSVGAWLAHYDAAAHEASLPSCGRWGFSLPDRVPPTTHIWFVGTTNGAIPLESAASLRP
jgi:hypothetical protein